MFQYFF